MASTNYQDAVRAGTAAAARLQRDLGLQARVETRGGSIDVFATIYKLDVPLLLRPLNGLLGAYINDPQSGILVTTQRPMNIQRFTAAHELGHYRLDHQPSLDDESILRRMPMKSQLRGSFEEVEADAFASEFMMPRWLIASHAQRQGWKMSDFQSARVVYQLALRMGASYEATCWTLVRNQLLASDEANELLATKPRTLKAELLEQHTPESYHGDVWLLTERDAGTLIEGSRNDLFVIRLKEHSNGGYLWDIDQLKESGFAVVLDQLHSIDDVGIGNPVFRHITTQPPEMFRGRLAIDESRPWNPSETLSTLELDIDLTGPEQEGLSRAERQRILSAA
jgi:Zn-dependent peptidase ImmA (M78 family)